MLEAAGSTSYPLLNVMWTMFVFFAWIMWFWLLITVFGDLFRRRDISGWGKAGWTIVLLFLPLIGVLTYMIVQGHSMATRRDAETRAAQDQFDSYVRSVAAPSDGNAAGKIAEAKQLLDSGAITTVEFEALKQRVLAG
jgi:hypothetical protein